MKHRTKIISFATLFLLGCITIPAFADQAAWISRNEASRALKELAEATSIKHFCAPCDDQSVTDEAIENIGLFRVEGQNYWEIRVNGKGIDLAYVYFQKRGRWVNAAMAARIKVSDVPRELSRAQLGR